MLVTGNGVVWSVEEVNDLWIADLLAAIDNISDTVDDDAADHALDVVCFLQDSDLYTPIDARFELPWGESFADSVWSEYGAE
jgi:hypothetical protein